MIALLIIGAIAYAVGGMLTLMHYSPKLSPESDQPSESEI